MQKILIVLNFIFKFFILLILFLVSSLCIFKKMLLKKIIKSIINNIITYLIPYNFNYFWGFGFLSVICLGEALFCASFLLTFSFVNILHQLLMLTKSGGRFIIFIFFKNINLIFRNLKCLLERIEMIILNFWKRMNLNYLKIKIKIINSNFNFDLMHEIDFLNDFDVINDLGFINSGNIFLSFFSLFLFCVFYYSSNKSEILDKYMYTTYLIIIYSGLVITLCMTSFHNLVIDSLKHTIWSVQILLFLSLLFIVRPALKKKLDKMSDDHIKFKKHYNLVNNELLNIHFEPDKFFIQYTKTSLNEMPFIITLKINNHIEKFFYMKSSFSDNYIKKGIIDANENKARTDAKVQNLSIEANKQKAVLDSRVEEIRTNTKKQLEMNNGTMTQENFDLKMKEVRNDSERKKRHIDFSLAQDIRDAFAEKDLIDKEIENSKKFSGYLYISEKSFTIKEIYTYEVLYKFVTKFKNKT